MAEVVKSCRLQDGSEVDSRFTVYLNKFEAASLVAFLRKEFSQEIPFELLPSHYVACSRIKESLERSF